MSLQQLPDLDRMTRDQLIERIYDLEARLDTVSVDMGLRLALRARFNLSSQLAHLLAILADGHVHTRIDIATAIRVRAEFVNVELVGVQMCKLRKALRSHGIKINTLWGDGYQIVEGLDLLKEAS